MLDEYTVWNIVNLLRPTGYVMHQQFNNQQQYVLPTLYMCFVLIWEQTATCATYSINWLVFITEMRSVYCAVPTGSLNKTVCASSLKSQSPYVQELQQKERVYSGPEHYIRAPSIEEVSCYHMKAEEQWDTRWRLDNSRLKVKARRCVERSI